MRTVESTTMVDRIQRDEIESYRTRVDADGSADAERYFLEMLNAMHHGTGYEFRIARAWLEFTLRVNAAR